MEMQKQLIMIAGIHSSGKTTISQRLKEFFLIDSEFCVDYVYFKIGEELKIKDFANPHIWMKQKQDLIRELKQKYYYEMLPRNDRVLIEGCGLLCRDDREIIKRFYDDHKSIFFYKDISLDDWLKFKGVLKCKSREDEFEYLKKISTIEKEAIIIT